MKKLVLWFLAMILCLSAKVGMTSEVKEVYQQNCAKCHGVDGKGQTTVGKKFKISDFTDAGWQAKNPPSKIKEVIEKGVKDKVGKELMVAYKNKLSPEEVLSLVQYIQKFANSNP